MHSSFNTDVQQDKVESKIVVALERMSEAFRVLLWNESKEHSLSPIQIQILIFIKFHSDEKCKVSYLAREFNMTKATISDSVRVLVKKELLIKVDDPSDTRSFTLRLTPAGEHIVNKASLFTSALEKPIDKLSLKQKQTMLDGLLRLIHDLQKSGIITIQRMCYTCSHYSTRDGGHYCSLLASALTTSDLRIDCPEHQAQ